MIGKTEFGSFITFLNLNKFNIDELTKTTLKKLIVLWNSNLENSMYLYLEKNTEYEIVTHFVREKNIKELSALWFLHVSKLSSQCLHLSNFPEDNILKKKIIESNILHYEFKMLYSEPIEKLSEEEKTMLKFYRRVAVMAILTGNKSYVEKPLIDKFLLNCRVSPYSKLNNHMIEIRKSDIHGNGVFAKENIKNGTVVTFYPVDGYSENSETDYKIADDWTNDNNTDNNTDNNIDVTNVYENYSCVINDNLKIIGNPNNTNKSELLGHMINDSIGCTFEDTNLDKIKDGIYEYYLKSNNNCKLKINEKYGLIYVVATKDIEKNEELTYQYGPMYWYTRISKNLEGFFDVCNKSEISEFILTHVEN